MNSKLLAGLAAAGVLASGGSATALAVAGAPAADARTVVVASAASKAPECGPLGPLVAKGTITHAQAVDIHNAFIRYAREHFRSTLDTVLGQQVKSHTITKAQASEVTKAITAWVEKYRGEESGHHGPCPYGHGGGMTHKPMMLPAREGQVLVLHLPRVVHHVEAGMADEEGQRP